MAPAVGGVLGAILLSTVAIVILILVLLVRKYRREKKEGLPRYEHWIMLIYIVHSSIPSDLNREQCCLCPCEWQIYNYRGINLVLRHMAMVRHEMIQKRKMMPFMNLLSKIITDLTKLCIMSHIKFTSLCASKFMLYGQIKNAICDLALFACTNCLTLKEYHQTMALWLCLSACSIQCTVVVCIIKSAMTLHYSL